MRESERERVRDSEYVSVCERERRIYRGREGQGKRECARLRVFERERDIYCV